MADRQPSPCSPCCIAVGGLFYVYATNSDGRNVQCAKSSDLVSWVSLCLVIYVGHCMRLADAAACGAAEVSPGLLHGDESTSCASNRLGLIQSLTLFPAAVHQVVHEENVLLVVPSTWCLPPGGLPGAHMLPGGALVCHQRCWLMWLQYSAPLAVWEHPQHRLVSFQQCTLVAAQQATASVTVSHGSS